MDCFVKVLLEKNADINVLDSDNMKPLDYGNIIYYNYIILKFYLLYSIAKSKHMKDYFTEAKNKKNPTSSTGTLEFL